MPRLIEEMSDSQIDQEIKNHRDWLAARKPYGPANKARLEELLAARANRAGLDLEKSLQVIREAAREGRFLSYKDLADASGAEWSKVYLNVGRHLWHVVEWAHARGMPMLSAIVVNKENQKTGEMRPETLQGFLGAAEELGRKVADGTTFLKEEQQRVFDYFRRDA